MAASLVLGFASVGLDEGYPDFPFGTPTAPGPPVPLGVAQVGLVCRASLFRGFEAYWGSTAEGRSHWFFETPVRARVQVENRDGVNPPRGWGPLQVI